MFIIRNILNDNNLDKDLPYNLTLVYVIQYKYAKIIRYVMWNFVSVNIKTYERQIEERLL